MDAPRLLRTLAYLKPQQIWGRIAFRLAKPRPDLSPPPALRPRAAPFLPPVPKPKTLLAGDRVRFLNEEGPIAWESPDRAKLWLYNLHYFDGLLAEDKAARGARGGALVSRWIAENPPGRGTGWEPYPVSLRVVNWIKWMLGEGRAAPEALASLAVQARWLERRLETHLLGNHLLANAKALVFAGVFFAGPEAERWLGKGLSLYRDQLPEQVLADGGHFERSPMYHAIILEDLLDLINLTQAYDLSGAPVLADLIPTADAMRAWLKAMCLGDERIGFFNDAAFAIAAEPAELEAYAARLGLIDIADPADGITDLKASGYARLQCGEAVVLVDAAPIGPDYLPGHAHADTLSFEWSLGAERIVVNGGTSVYGTSPEREAERSTAAHSTIEIAELNSSEVWSGFRVGRRARIVERRFEEAETELIVEAAHDGYRWLPGRPLHRRRWALGDGVLRVHDEIDGAGAAVARLHLGRGVAARVDEGGLSGGLTTPGGRVIAWRASHPVRVEASHWAPEFGLRLKTQALVAAPAPSGFTIDLAW